MAYKAQFNPNDPKHLTKIQNTPFITFVGLQKLAADRGLQLTSTQFELVQAPNEENGNRAVVYAQLFFDRYKKRDGDGNFSGDPEPIGPFCAFADADNKNVGKNIQPHVLRQAQTRAAAIAFRYATRADWTSSVEMIGDEK